MWVKRAMRDGKGRKMFTTVKLDRMSDDLQIRVGPRDGELNGEKIFGPETKIALHVVFLVCRTLNG